MFKGTNETHNVTRWCLSGEGFHEMYHNQTDKSSGNKTTTFSLTIMMLGLDDTSINCTATNISTVSFCTTDSYEEACLNKTPSLTFRTRDDDDDARDWLIWVWIVLVALIVIIVVTIIYKYITGL